MFAADVLGHPNQRAAAGVRRWPPPWTATVALRSPCAVAAAGVLDTPRVDESPSPCLYMHLSMETRTSHIRHRWENDGWYLDRHGANHDIYRHPRITGIITLPRHRQVSVGVAHSIAKQAGWPAE